MGKVSVIIYMLPAYCPGANCPCSKQAPPVYFYNQEGFPAQFICLPLLFVSKSYLPIHSSCRSLCILSCISVFDYKCCIKWEEGQSMVSDFNEIAIAASNETRYLSLILLSYNSRLVGKSQKVSSG
jgi:hypothetical protein